MGIVWRLGRAAVRLSTEAGEREGRRAWTKARVGGAGPVGVPARAVDTGANEDARQIAPDQTRVCDSTREREGGRTS
jgi:hypothetical protein